MDAGVSGGPGSAMHRQEALHRVRDTGAQLIGTFRFFAFVVMLLGAVPIAVALGLAGALAIWFGGQSIMAVPTNVYTGIAKYPLIAIPMFVLVGSVFDRTGVALRLVRFATALVGAGRGALATVAMIIATIIA